MKIKLKNVYYCDFCKKHGLASWAMKEHEKHCTLNPDRKCGLCDRKGVYKKGIKFIDKAFKKLMSHRINDGGISGEHDRKFEDAIKKLSDELECPVCVFSVLRQSKEGISCWGSYDFKMEMQKYWKEKAEEEEEREYYSNLL